MKKFRYRLQALLKVKQHIEKERQRDHAAALREVLGQEGRLGTIADSRQQALGGQRRRLSGSISVAEMLVFSRYLVRLKRDMLAGRELLKGLKKSEQIQRQCLLEASRERKKYEKLRERQQERFNDNVRRIETRENDDIALDSHRLKRWRS